MKPYPIENLRQRGLYVARIDGLDDRYGVARSFLTGKAAGPVWEYTEGHIGALPAWLVRSGAVCTGCGRSDPKQVELIAAGELGYEVVGIYSTKDLITIWESGLPFLTDDDPVRQVGDALDERVTVFAGDLEAPF